MPRALSRALSVTSRPLPVCALLMLAGLAWSSTTGGLALAQDLSVADKRSSTTSAPEAAARSRVGLIEITGTPLDRAPELSWLFGRGDEVTLRELTSAIRDAGENDAIDGLTLRLKDAALGLTQVEEIADAIADFRATGKKVTLFAEAFGPLEFVLASHVDHVMAQQGGPVTLPGLYVEEMFLADTLAWAGLRADYVQVGDYKGAAEQMSNSTPSPQWNENINQLLDSLYANIRRPLLAGRGMDDARLDSAMSELWYAEADAAKRAGLIDSTIDLPNLSDALREVYGNPVSWRTNLVEHEGGAADMSNPFAIFSLLSQKPDTSIDGPTIAVVHIDGPIMDGDSGSEGFTGGSTVGSRTIRNALEELLKEDDVRGVILRIDSPGGSATASEVIWQGVRRVAEKKPVWVSVGSMAASGGYYIAVAGDRIYVNPSSIVGSIGVVGGKISMEGLYDHLRVNVVSRARGPKASLFASNASWTPEQREEVRARMAETYEQFTQRVTMGREGIDLARTAEGRLFTGDKAIALRMADEVGGLDEAITDLATELGLESYDVKDFPPPRSFEDVIEEAFGGMVRSPQAARAALQEQAGNAVIAGAARSLLGDAAWRQLEPSVTGFLQMRDQRVLLMSPRALIFK